MSLTEQKTETLDGTTIWRLRGVTLDNMPTVLRTNAWIHYSDLGDEGWGLVAHGVQAESWRGQLARHGIEITPWPKLPIKPYGRKTILSMAAVFVLAIPTIFGAFILAGIFGIMIYLHTKNIRHIRIAPGLRKVLGHTSIGNNYAHLPEVREG